MRQTFADPLHERLNPSAVQKAAEGLDSLAKMLSELSETRVKIKNLKKMEEEWTEVIKNHIKETGEIVDNGVQQAVLEVSTTVSYDADELAFVLGKRFEECQSFDKKKLDALIELGKVSEAEIEPCKQTKTVERLCIRGK